MNRNRRALSQSLAALLTLALSGPSLHPQTPLAPAPASSKPDASTPEAAKPDTSKPDASQPDTGKQDLSSTQESSAPDGGKPEASKPQPNLAQVTPEPGSGVRIVRLSEIKGVAQMDRNTDRGYEAAFANLPVVQGSKLRTAEGVAEVEFEDNSTLRLTPNTVVEFPQLRLSPTGATLSTIHVLKGTVYVSLTSSAKSGKKPANQVTVLFGVDKLLLAPSSHIQLAVADPATRLAVLEGSAQVEDPSGITTLGKKKSLLFDPAGKTPPTQVANLEKTDFDAWDKNAADYHKHVANVSAFAGSSGFSGINDLNYYGSFSNVAGCGNVWRPYLTSAAWDPYANGTWAWYPGAGYSFVSPYPWGWAPFHSGEWQLCNSGGYGWRPGGNWRGLVNTPKAPGVGPTHLRPPLPPSPGHPTLVRVDVRPLSESKLASPQTFVFRNDSAGLGVPRQGFRNLNKISTSVAQKGTVTTPVYVAPGLASSHSSMQPNRGYGGNGQALVNSQARSTSTGSNPNRPSNASTGSAHSGAATVSSASSASSVHSVSSGASAGASSHASSGGAPSSAPSSSGPASSSHR